MHVLLRQDVLQHLFGGLRADFKNKLESEKWSCVCKTWCRAHVQWCVFAEAIVEDFKMQYLPVISANRDISAVIHVMTKYMWDYEIMTECLELVDDWTSPVEGASDMNMIYGGEEEMEEGGEEEMEEGGEEEMEEGGREMEEGGGGVMEETDKKLVAVETNIQKLQEENENVQLSNDQLKDDFYEVADVDDKVDVFESLVDMNRDVKRVAVGDLVDAGTLVEYNKIVVMIVQVMKEFKIVYHSLVTLKSQCLQCLANLAAFREVRVEMGTREFFHEVMLTIGYINVNSDIGRAVNVLMAACGGNDAAKQAFIDEEGFLFLGKLCRQSNMSKYIDFDVCLFVLDLCKREGDVVCLQEVDSAVIVFLRDCAAKYVDCSRFIHNVSRTIHFVVTNTSNKKEFMKDGGMQIMETVLAKYSDNPVVREFTSAALDNMRSTFNV